MLDEIDQTVESISLEQEQQESAKEVPVTKKKIVHHIPNIGGSIRANLPEWPEVSGKCRKCGRTVYIHVLPSLVESLSGCENVLCEECDPKSFWYTEEHRPGRSIDKSR